VWIPLLLTIYCVLIALASLLGGVLPSLVRLTHNRMQRLLSFVGGLILGVGLLHLVPHATATLRSLDLSMRWVAGGVLTTFFLIRAFHTHSHDVPGDGHGHSHDCGHSHDHGHDHSHDHDAKPALVTLGLPQAAATPPDSGREDLPAPAATGGRWNWLGLALGLALHTLIDGLALGASVAAEAAHGESTFGLFALGTFLAVALHKPLDSLSIMSLMTASAWSPRWKWLVNCGYALMCPLGALLFFYGVRQTTDLQDYFVGISVAFAGGVFICIAAADLLPEIQFHSHNRVVLSLLIILGMFAAYGIGFLEPSHQHGGHTHGAHGHSH
jgi:zinc and cadmium transporter